MEPDTSWLPDVSYTIPTEQFWSQYWAIFNMFQPLILPLVGLAASIIIMRIVIKAAFGGGGNG